MEEIFSKVKINVKYKFGFISSLFIFFLTHAYFFLGKYTNEDYHYFFNGRKHTVTSGRWLGDIYTDYLMPWVVGIISAILISGAVVLIILIFDLNDKVGIVMTSILMITFPTLSYSYPYLHYANIYSISIFTAILSVCLVYKLKVKWLGILLGSLSLMISLAEYQSYIGVAMSLCALRIIFEILENKKNIKEIWSDIASFLAMGILGVIFYFIGLEIMLNIYGVELVSYKGADSMGKISLSELPLLIIKSYRRFFEFFNGKSFFYADDKLTIVYYMNIVITIFIIISTLLKHKNIMKTSLAIVVLLVLPMCFNIVDIIAPETSSSTLNIYQIVFLFSFPIWLVEKFVVFFDENNILKFSKLKIDKNIALIVITLYTTIHIGLNNFILSNVYYLQVSTVFDHTTSFYNRLFLRIEELDSFQQDMKIAMLTDGGAEFYLNTVDLFPILQSDQGTWGKITGINSTSYNSSRKAATLMQNLLGVSIKTASSDEITQIKLNNDVQEMSLYPDKDSIKIIDDTVVVKFVDYWDILITENNKTIDFSLLSPNYYKDEQYNIAWYFYKNDERIDIKWYQKEYFATFQFDGPGEYYVRCFVKEDNDDFVIKFNSNKITIN